MLSVSRRKFLSRGLSALTIPFIPFNGRAAVEAPESHFTILFQGDSITDGNRGRSEDPNHILGHGYAFSIASELGSKFPDRNLKFINKGVSGDKISDLQLRWKQDAIELKPDVLSILVGINDILGFINRKEAFNSRTFEAEYNALLESTKQSLPTTLLVIGEPFILPVGMVNNNAARWNDMIRSAQGISKKLATDYNGVFLPYQKVFNDACQRASAEYWIWDGIHPTYSGHGLMKNCWLEEVGKRCRKIV